MKSNLDLQSQINQLTEISKIKDNLEQQFIDHKNYEKERDKEIAEMMKRLNMAGDNVLQCE